MKFKLIAPNPTNVKKNAKRMIRITAYSGFFFLFEIVF